MTSSVLLQKLVEVKPGFAEVLKGCQSDPRVQGMPLSFFLLKPVKRITEYPILLEKLVKHTEVDHPDLFNVERALEISKKLCDQVDEGMRQKENSERLEWLQIHVDAQGPEKIVFNSATNIMGSRKFLHHGVLKKAKSGKELVGFLFNDFLLLTLPSRPIQGQFSFDKHHDIELKPYRNPIFLVSLSLSSVPEEDSRLSLEVSGSESGPKSLAYMTQVEFLNGNECRLWTNKLKEAINNAKDRNKDYNDTKTAGEYLKVQIFYQCFTV